MQHITPYFISIMSDSIFLAIAGVILHWVYAGVITAFCFKGGEIL